MKTAIKRRSFISAALAALCGCFVAAPSVRSFVVALTSREDGEVWTGAGSSIRAAMSSLRANLEGATCEFDEYFAEVFEESTAELEGGALRASHWDFSCPESAYDVELLEGGRVS